MSMCPDCGGDHHPEEIAAQASAEAAHEMAGAEVDATKAAARGDVSVAQIEAEAAVELARIDAKVQKGWQEARVAELEGRLGGMEDVLKRLTTPAAPAPAEAAPEPVQEVVQDEPAAPVEQAAPKPEKKRAKGWWG